MRITVILHVQFQLRSRTAPLTRMAIATDLTVVVAAAAVVEDVVEYSPQVATVLPVQRHPTLMLLEPQPIRLGPPEDFGHVVFQSSTRSGAFDYISSTVLGVAY